MYMQMLRRQCDAKRARALDEELGSAAGPLGRRLIAAAQAAAAMHLAEQARRSLLSPSQVVWKSGDARPISEGGGR